MTDFLPVLPVLVPLLAAAASILAWSRPNVQRALGIAGAAALLAAAVALLWVVRARGIQVVQFGAWPAPFGISFVADLLGSIMTLVAGLIGLAVMVYSRGTIDAAREAHGYYPLTHLLLMGVCGSFLTGDIFNLFVWFEVMLISSFVLLALGGERGQMEGGLKYVAINLLSSAVFLVGVGILYGMVGTLNMADVAHKLSDVENQGMVTTVGMLFLVAFGTKAAVFPLFFWLPSSYHTPPVAVSALFGGLLTKVGVYAIMRVFTLIFVHEPGFTHTVLLVVAGLTMVTGVLGAMSHNEFRRILSFHIISQIGYMIMGIGLFVPLAVAGSIFYTVHNIIAKTNLFLISGVAHRWLGSFELKKLGGLYASHPALAGLFLVSALGLAGIPPLSGFFAKLILAVAGFREGSYFIVAVALFVGMLTLFSMLKIWNEAFWKPLPAGGAGNGGTAGGAGAGAGGREEAGPLWALMVPVTALAALIVALGLFAQPFLSLCEAAAEQMLDRSIYIEAVLGRQP